MSMMSGHKKDKGFSSHNKIQRYHGDGTESIIVMGRPFRVINRIGDNTPSAYLGTGARPKHLESKHSYVFLVENSSHLPEFPRHVALRRSFFNVDEVTEAHKEIDIMSHIKDKNIVRVYHSEISRNEGKLGVSIVMEYCGNNLYRRIRSGAGSGAGVRMTESEICHVLLAVTSAVGYLHSQQPPIAHRDIRPENILINNAQTGPMAYKLCNFGSSTTEAYKCETREEASVAIADIELHTNPGFRAPEMADPWSGRRICEKADMWAIGVLLYYMMYLQLPFKPNNMALSGNPRVHFPPGTEMRYSASLRQILEHLLEPDPERRWDVFALTNFLRFDEDVSRHLGIFVFTCTEWPEGWEEQDVKVLNRERPAKNSPITYNEPGHARIESPKTHNPITDNTSNYKNNNHSSEDNNGSHNNTNSYDDEEASLRVAMMLLTGEANSNDPAAAAARAKMLKEQEEAWEQAKASSSNAAGTGGKGKSPTSDNNKNSSSNGSDNDDDDDDSKKEESENAAEAEAAAAKKKVDLMDDLFASPAVSSTANNQSSSQVESGKEPKRLTADDLFSNSVPTNAMGMGMYAPQPQQQQFPPNMTIPATFANTPLPSATGIPANAMNDFSSGLPAPMMPMMANNEWSSGNPMLPDNNINYAIPIAQPGMTIPANSTNAFYGATGNDNYNFANFGNAMNNNNNNNATNMTWNTVNTTSPPPPALQQQSQMPLNQVNFLAPGPGDVVKNNNNTSINNNTSGNSNSNNMGSQQKPTTSKKDPFANLFS